MTDPQCPPPTFEASPFMLNSRLTSISHLSLFTFSALPRTFTSLFLSCPVSLSLSIPQPHSFTDHQSPYEHDFYLSNYNCVCFVIFNIKKPKNSQKGKMYYKSGNGETIVTEMSHLHSHCLKINLTESFSYFHLQTES